MLKAIQKVPAGTFLIPMLLGLIVGTIWPDLFTNIGGLSEALFSSNAASTMVALVTFASGASIDIKSLGPVLKRHGTMYVMKIIWGLVLSFLFLSLFGLDGILGIPAVGFVIVVLSISPSVWLAINQDVGNEEASALMGLQGILPLPIIPQLVFTAYFAITGGQGASVDLMPIFASLLPLIVGIILGNLDGDIRKFFTPLISILMPFLGWTTGQGMDLGAALESGLPGILMAVLLFVLMLPLIFADRKILGYDGTAGASMMTSAGMSAATPAVLASAFPTLEPYTASAAGIILAVAIISSFLNPVFAKWYDQKVSVSA